MAYINFQPSDYFNTKTWTGTGSSNALTGIGFQSDLVWIKQRGGTTDHHLYDAVRGTTKALASNDSAAETTKATGLTAFGSDGFTLGADAGVNGSSNTYVGWSWKANGAGSANTDGSINTTATSVNTTAGISICKWTGTAANATIGHGLGVAPKAIMIKNTERDGNWIVYHKNLTSYSYRLNLDGSGAENNSSGSTYWTADPTSSVFSIGDNTRLNANGEVQIAYCFAETKGFSRISKWTGNGNTNGPFLYTGFKPAFFLYKEAGQSGQNWTIVDNKRDTRNVMGKLLHPDLNNAESDQTGSTAINIDFLSNGIKIRGNDANINRSGSSYIYMAFAAEPLVASNGDVATAR